jgi:D-alanyl-D-alanine carboxypeptidase
MIDSLIERILNDGHIPGLALAVQQHHTVIHAGYYGYANLEHRVPVTQDTVFEIASVTKLFTTQAILYLVQHNRLTLDDKLADHLANLPDAWQAITVRHCLTHQSGLPSYTSGDAYWQRTREDKTHDEILALVRDLPLRFEPGTHHAYDNTGFYLLGLVIEAVSGEPYADFLKRIIFDPLNIANTRANHYADIIPNRAQGYTYYKKTLANKAFYSTSNTFSAGILLSTVPDLLTWRASLFNDSILNVHYRDLWWKPHPSQAGNERDGGYSLGLGWFILDSPLGQLVGHNGSIAGFSSAFMYFPSSGITAVVLCNAQHVTEPHEIAYQVIELLL